ncbi:MAG: hypothetical protein AAF202_02900 [Pseudomonadota bacterium]
MAFLILQIAACVLVSVCSQWAQADSSELHVDLVIHHLSGTQVTESQILEQASLADALFSMAGVRVNVLEHVYHTLDDRFADLDGMQPFASPDEVTKSHNFYRDLQSKKVSFSPEALEVFAKVLNSGQFPEKAVHIVLAIGVRLAFYDKDKEGNWKIQSVKTGGLSFPPYYLNPLSPVHLPELITITHHRPTILAHELGHKLINVTHEGYRECPAFSGSSIPGLMGYHSAKDIGKGWRGRWHQERLRKSPLLYKNSPGGQRVYNQDFFEGGHYADPIYGPYIMNPICL